MIGRVVVREPNRLAALYREHLRLEDELPLVHCRGGIYCLAAAAGVGQEHGDILEASTAVHVEHRLSASSLNDGCVRRRSTLKRNPSLDYTGRILSDRTDCHAEENDYRHADDSANHSVMLPDTHDRCGSQRSVDMAFAPAIRRLTFATHVTSSAGWVGAVLVFLALASIALISEDERTVRGAYLVMAPAAWLVLVPLAHASLLSGIVLSLGTPWGLFRHYWVVLKLAITVSSTIILLIYMGTFRQMAGVAADPVVQLGVIRNPSPVVHAALALILLLIATWLAVYKPFGLTPCARRFNRQGSGDSSAAAVPPWAIPPNPATGTPIWVYVIGVAVLLVMLVIVLLHLSGTSFGH